jgi:hypothetical protein
MERVLVDRWAWRTLVGTVEAAIIVSPTFKATNVVYQPR